MKRTARTALLAAALIMSMSILPVEQVWADSDDVTETVKEVEISGSGYIGAAPSEEEEEPDTDEEETDELPVGGSGGDDGSGERKAAGFSSPVTGDQLQLFSYIAALICSAALICGLMTRYHRVRK